MMNRPTGWKPKPNPQAMAQISKRTEYTGHELLGNFADVDTWLTPRYLLDQLGAFDLDPCAAAQNPAWVAPRFYTKEHDGLRSEWSGRVFMNPPFSNTIPWIERHADHLLGISLVPFRGESQVWRRVVWKRAQAIFLIHGRMRFCNPDGSTTTGRPLGSVALISWTPEEVQTLERITVAGILLTSWKQV